MDLARMVAGCYGPDAPYFAGHANDEEWAFQLLTYARKNGIGWAALRAEFETYLGKRMTAPGGDGPQQIETIERYFRPWLFD